MKKKLIRLVFALLIPVFIASCGRQCDYTEQEIKSQDSQEKYSLISDSIQVSWAAFKTTDRIAVSGTFDSVEVVSSIVGGTIDKLLLNTKVTIFTSSVNSNNSIRDEKIRTLFFGNTNTKSASIIGSIDSIIDAEKVSLLVTMNGEVYTVEASYKVEDELLKLSFPIDVLNWGMTESLSALNTACEDLHKGADGISKLWPDVEVTVVGRLSFFNMGNNL